jgi:hypothetical protein
LTVESPPNLGDLGGLTLKLSYLAALTVMSVCPVCKYNHLEEVSHCSRCNWSMQNNIEISPEHEILTTCIPTLVKCLENEQRAKNGLLSHIQILDPDIQIMNNLKLDKIQEEIKNDREQTNKQFSNLEEIVNELKLLLKDKKNSDYFSSLATEHGSPELNQTSKNNTVIEDSNNEFLRQSDYQSNSLVNSSIFFRDSNHDDSFIEESDRNVNNDLNPTDELLEDSFYEMNNSSFFDNSNDQETLKPEINSNRSYQSFYRLIKNGELEVTKVAVPQETMEKIRGGTQSEFKFVNDQKGNYWIVNWHDVYCLIPKDKTYINQYQYGNFQRVFNCQNYKETYSDFEIIEPTIVFNSNDGTWQLERKGKIKFI